MFVNGVNAGLNGPIFRLMRVKIQRMGLGLIEFQLALFVKGKLGQGEKLTWWCARARPRHNQGMMFQKMPFILKRHLLH